MSDSDRLSTARAILLAVELCVRGNVDALPQLQWRYPTSLSTERLLRIILTFVPESTPPSQYTPILQALVDGENAEVNTAPLDITPVKDIPEQIARKRVQRLRLLPLRHPEAHLTADPADLLTQFLIHRAHLIDSYTGLQSLILELLLPFYERSEILRAWLLSRLLPLLRTNYEYYPERDQKLSLDMLESLDRGSAVELLLSMSSSGKSKPDLARNLRGLVGPWIAGVTEFKRQKSNVSGDDGLRSGWREVNEWLLSRSSSDRDLVVDAFTQWDGPGDVDLGGYERRDVNEDQIRLLQQDYGQTGLAIVYAADANVKSLEGSFKIVSRVPTLLQIDLDANIPIDSPTLPSLRLNLDAISSASRASLLHNTLLDPSNPLTVPSATSLAFVRALLLSLRILQEFGHPISCSAAATMCLQGSEDAQSRMLRSIVDSIAKQTRASRSWPRIREQILWLREWGHPTGGDKYHGLLWRIPRDVMETEILKTMLIVGEYKFAADTYTTHDSPLSLTQAEMAVTETIVMFYDNASNGNKTRGKMKKALEILKAFQPRFPDAESFKKIEALISAAHSLSFYSLTLQHEVPFQPVSIRVHPDPLSLIGKVLEQNAKSYTKLDDLLSIGQNLVAAGLPITAEDDSQSDEHNQTPLTAEAASKLAERRIISMGASSALAAGDFGTAYSYILTRLTPQSVLSTPQTLSPGIPDNISWRAAYAAGRHRPNLSSSADLHTQITTLTQRMELLSLALMLAPTGDPLPEILGAWRRCDEELTTLRAREAREAEEWDRRGDTVRGGVLPGAFGPSDRELDAMENDEQQRLRRARSRAQRPPPSSSSTADTYDDEAPMGLFEVARGAARAFSRTAFPLHRPQNSSSSVPDSAAPGDSGSSTPDRSEDQQQPTRVRKRDMVSNMVTEGLVTGIGWVLGAQPVNQR